MKTKQEVLNFLESKLGTKVPCVGNESLSGQCVTLIKSLMEFLGVPDPYKARGHAKDCIAKYISEGIAKQGMGIVSVYSNKDMGGGYGHIWCSVDGVFYESNGVKPLTVTKGKTYPYDNICNFDSYITENMYRGYDLSNTESMRICVDDHIRVSEGQLIDKAQYESIKGQLTEVQSQNDSLRSELGSVRSDLSATLTKVESLNNALGQYQKDDAVQLNTIKTYENERNAYKNSFIQLLGDVREELKLSSTIDDESMATSEALAALHSLYQRLEDIESELDDERGRVYDREATITKLLKQLETAKTYKGIEKLSLFTLLLEIKRRILWSVKKDK